MIRHLGGALLVACVLLATAANEVTAEAPAGPRLAFLSGSDVRFEVLTVDSSGGGPVAIAGGGLRARPLPLPYGSVTWSPDGTELAFVGLSGSEDDPRYDLYLVSADGGGVERIPATRNALYPLFSPEGRRLVFTRVARSRRTQRGRSGRPRTRFSTWLADLASGTVTRLPTSASELVSSFSPDGSTLVASRADSAEAREDIVAIALPSGRRTLLVRNAGEPAYSPDGSRIAFLRGPRRTFRDRFGTTTEALTDIYTMNPDGTGIARVTRTPRKIEASLSWDPSGQRLAYVELRAGAGEADFLGIGDSIMQVNLDGSCRTRLAFTPKTILAAPAWQPGPGREAGPIPC